MDQKELIQSILQSIGVLELDVLDIEKNIEFLETTLEAKTKKEAETFQKLNTIFEQKTKELSTNNPKIQIISDKIQLRKKASAEKLKIFEEEISKKNEEKIKVLDQIAEQKKQLVALAS